MSPQNAIKLETAMEASPVAILAERQSQAKNMRRLFCCEKPELTPGPDLCLPSFCRRSRLFNPPYAVTNGLRMRTKPMLLPSLCRLRIGSLAMSVFVLCPLYQLFLRRGVEEVSFLFSFRGIAFCCGWWTIGCFYRMMEYTRDCLFLVSRCAFRLS